MARVHCKGQAARKRTRCEQVSIRQDASDGVCPNMPLGVPPKVCLWLHLERPWAAGPVRLAGNGLFHRVPLPRFAVRPRLLVRPGTVRPLGAPTQARARRRRGGGARMPCHTVRLGRGRRRCSAMRDACGGVHCLVRFVFHRVVRLAGADAPTSRGDGRSHRAAFRARRLSRVLRHRAELQQLHALRPRAGGRLAAACLACLRVEHARL